ncbi:TatD family hydrolase [Apibacter sp. B2912]|uniref:TatD family hydrolase n=1 Tax=Apibacter sp. B2912 TaxID=2656763 RepID=UPI0013721505|nr:TatD family hydrolase [Apibacter sp. B2912]MXO32905.1 YchF/TatD family DNA exonuclease [Apibacter sp. B2912]
MLLIDSHTHLYSEQFDHDREEVIQRALGHGVQRFYLPSINSSYYPKMEELKNKYPENMFLMMGLHPCDVKLDSFEKELAFIENKLSEEKFAAIGEIGLDLFWDTSTLEIQKYAFIKQIQLAKQYKLPIVIHIREAFNEVLEIVRKEKDANLYGIIHCFTGNLEQAKEFVDLGFYLGIGGVVTFKNGKIDQFLKEIPIEKIVLETDSPYLAPSPFRGKRNESSYLKIIADKLSDIYEMLPEKIGTITSENARKIFKL